MDSLGMSFQWFFSCQSKVNGAELNMVHLTHELGGLHQENNNEYQVLHQENNNEYQVLHDLKQQQGFHLFYTTFTTY